MDQHKLRTLVFERTGVRIDVDDPVFALVALNEAVLEEAVERHIAALDEAARALVQHARAAGGITPGASADASAAGATPAPAHAERRIALIAGAAAVLGAALVLAGQALFFRPPAQPAPVVQARELTPEQSAALRKADKLEKAVATLDAKARAAVRAELQKP